MATIETVYVGSAQHLVRYKVLDSAGEFVRLFKSYDEALAFVDSSDEELPGVTMSDALQDGGPIVKIERDRGLLHITIAPDGDFGKELDCRSVSLNLDELSDELAAIGLQISR